MFAITDLQRHIANEISKRINREVVCARYVDISDSYHIYGSYFDEFMKFLDSIVIRPFETRVWKSDDEIVKEAFEGGKKILEREKITGEKGKII